MPVLQVGLQGLLHLGDSARLSGQEHVFEIDRIAQPVEVLRAAKVEAGRLQVAAAPAAARQLKMGFAAVGPDLHAGLQVALGCRPIAIQQGLLGLPPMPFRPELYVKEVGAESHDCQASDSNAARNERAMTQVAENSLPATAAAPNGVGLTRNGLHMRI